MVASVQTDGINRAATFDHTRCYRYSLVRAWDAIAAQSSEWPQNSKWLVFIMLNPSTADHRMEDPTIRRCIGFAQRWGYTQLEVVNLFGWRTPKPTDLHQASDPIGPENDAYLLTAARRAGQIILAWGNGGQLLGRDRAAYQLLSPYLSKCYCLGWTQQRQPRHPLYLKRTVAQQPVLPNLLSAR
ncbi:MAG: DUF1643 domain-containing protein [Cyanobacteria bacterium P01_H01_bin.119]